VSPLLAAHRAGDDIREVLFTAANPLSGSDMMRIRTAVSLIVALALFARPSRASDDPRLIPAPASITAGALTALNRTVSIDGAVSDDDKFTARDLAETLTERGLHAVVAGGAGYHIVFARLDSPAAKRELEERKLEFTDAMKLEGYVIIADRDETTIIAASAAGLFYGAQTVKQLIRTDGPGPRIHLAVIHDWPAMKYRGIQDDLSRGPVRTLEFQKKQIRIFAAYKINVFSPYFEHTLAHLANPLIAPPGGAMSREDVKTLVAYARRYHIDVIPEQEAFGHLHHVLKYDLYSAIGETDHGHVLAPGDPASIPLIKSWFAEIDSLFPSKFVHLGADETFELGLGRTKDRVQRDGIGTVYLDFLKQIELTLRPSGKRFLFWGDIAQGEPALVKSLPHDMIAVGWNYWSFDKFDALIKPFADAGIETWVAPGVNGWNRVFPNNDIALRNIQGFVRDGQRLGSSGMLNTSWGDDGEAIWNQQWYGVLFGAAAGWQKGESSIPAFQESYGLVFHGDASGMIDEAERKLSAAHATLQKAGVGEGTNALYWIDPYSAEGQLAAQRIRPVARAMRILAESALVLIAGARQHPLREPDALDAMEMGARRLDFIGMKFQFADDIVRNYARAGDPAYKDSVSHLLTEIASNINSRTQDLRDGYVLGRELYEKSWRAENRPYWLYNVLNRYDLAAQLWISRIDKFNQARAMYGRTMTLPPAEQLGIPHSMPGLQP
jgi:hypothetical protein